MKQLKRKLSRLRRSLKFIWHHPIASRNRFAALSRYIVFHIINLFTNKRRPYRFIEATHLLVKQGDAGLVGNIYAGLSDFEQMSFVLHYLSKDDLFVDVGANLGSYILLASGVKRAFSVGFEPNPITYKILEQEVQFNKINDRVVVENMGVGRINTTAEFTTNLGTMDHISFSGGENVTHEVTQIRIVSLDQYALPMESWNHTLWKVDVEGYEYEVLSGAVDRLRDNRVKAIMVETNGMINRYGHTLDDLCSFLARHNFDPYQYDPFTRQLNKLETVNDDNTIFIRDIDFVSERVKQAPKYRKYGVTF